jgi:hypothetical protein
MSSQTGQQTLIFITWQGLVGGWPKDDYANAGRQMETLTDTDRSYALRALAEQWAKMDPAAAAAWGDSLSDGQDKGGFISMVFSVWANSDPSGAMSAVEKMTDPAAQKTALMQVLSNPKIDTADALSVAEQLPDAGAQKAALGAIIGNWLQNDPPGAISYLEAMPDGSARDRLLQNISMGASGNYETLSKMVEQIPAGPMQNAVLSNLLRGWADPNGFIGDGRTLDAAAWAAALPNDDLRTRACGDVMDSWANTDPAAADQWLATLPAGPARDNAVYAFAAYKGREYPEAAGHWAETMAPSQSRGIAMYNSGLYWLQQDCPAATAWIAQSTVFSDGEKKKLLGSNWKANP